MSQVNLDNCREVTQTLIDEKVRDKMNATLDRLQIKVNVMKDELASEAAEASSTIVDQEEQNNDHDGLKRADKVDSVATAWLDDGMSSPPFSATDIEAEVNIVTKNDVN